MADDRRPVAVLRNHQLVFGDGLLGVPLGAQQDRPSVVREGAQRRRLQDLLDEPPGALDIGAGRLGHHVEGARKQRGREQARRLDRPRVERQRAFGRLADRARSS